jgi:hypothetical protein
LCDSLFDTLPLEYYRARSIFVIVVAISSEIEENGSNVNLASLSSPSLAAFNNTQILIARFSIAFYVYQITESGHTSTMSPKLKPSGSNMNLASLSSLSLPHPNTYNDSGVNNTNDNNNGGGGGGGGDGDGDGGGVGIWRNSFKRGSTQRTFGDSNSTLNGNGSRSWGGSGGGSGGGGGGDKEHSPHDSRTIDRRSLT